MVRVSRYFSRSRVIFSTGSIQENAEPIQMGFPHGQGCLSIFGYLIALPVMGPLYVTLPDPYHHSSKINITHPYVMVLIQYLF